MIKTLRRPLLHVAMVLTIALLSLAGAMVRQSSAVSQDEWRKEFEDVCSRTDDAMNFSREELRSMIRRCDSLKPQIDKLDETQKKVYLRRLHLCRELFVFVLESGEKQ